MFCADHPRTLLSHLISGPIICFCAVLLWNASFCPAQSKPSRAENQHLFDQTKDQTPNVVAGFDCAPGSPVGGWGEVFCDATCLKAVCVYGGGDSLVYCPPVIIASGI